MDSGIVYQTDGRRGERQTRAQIGPGVPPLARKTRRQLQAEFDAAAFLPDDRVQRFMHHDPEFARLFGGAGSAKRKGMGMGITGGPIGSAVGGRGIVVAGTGRPTAK